MILAFNVAYFFCNFPEGYDPEWNMEEIRIPIAFVVMIILLLTIFNQYVIKPKGDTASLSRLAWTALILVISGLLLGKFPAIGYILIGSGMVLAVADILNNTLKKGKPL